MATPTPANPTSSGVSPLPPPDTRSGPQLEPTPADRLAEHLLAGPMTLLVGALCLIQLATWVPHYLTWPLWADHDVFATLARGWEAGLLPYRDLRCNQFPGEIYLFYLLGRLAGWGRIWTIYAFDVAALLSLGLGLILWSRRLFGRALPGFVGFLSFASYYLSLDYMMAAQRDWHSALLAVLGLLILQASRRGVVGPLISGAALSMALSIRPHAAVFLPVVAMQLLGDLRGGAGARRIGAWIGGFLIMTVAWILPLAASGLLPEFVAAVGRNNDPTADRGFHLTALVVNVLRQLDAFSFLVVGIGVCLLPKPDRGRTLAATVWLAALACVLLYEPLSPRFHSYLRIPLNLVLAVNVAMLTFLVLAAGRIPLSFRLVSVLLVLGVACRVRPDFCTLRPSLKAAAVGLSDELTEATPPGYRRKPDSVSGYYDWADYRAMLEYLRRWPSKATRIANALRADPAVVGCLGRLPAFPAESIAWLRMVDRGDQARFARSLESEPDSLVVWAPHDAGPAPRIPIDQIESTIRRLYEPDARFGVIEVWRRKLSPAPGTPVANQTAGSPRVGG